MKKSTKSIAKAVGVCVSAAAVSAMLAGCDFFSPFQNRPVALYGPPEMLDPEQPEDKVPETVYGPPEWFFPGDNVPEDVYGPPPFEEDYHPEEELPAPVYGPPEWFESEPVSPAPEAETP